MWVQSPNNAHQCLEFHSYKRRKGLPGASSLIVIKWNCLFEHNPEYRVCNTRGIVLAKWFFPDM